MLAPTILVARPFPVVGINLEITPIREFTNGQVSALRRPETVAAMRKALEKAGVIFTDGKRPGVRVAT